MLDSTGDKAQKVDEVRMLKAEGFSIVYTDHGWHNNRPKRGTADIEGAPHYFSLDIREEITRATYLVWPVTAEILALEKMSYRILAEWQRLVKMGEVTVEHHPAYGPLDSSYNKISRLLNRHRKTRFSAKRMAGEWRRLHHGQCSTEGTGYMMRWSPA